MGRLPAFFVLFFLGCQSPAPSPTRLLDCMFIPLQFAEDQLAACAARDASGRLLLSEAGEAEIRRRGEGAHAVQIGGRLYYANAEGRIVRVLWHDNGADSFVEGLARTARGGKVGFVDESLAERIAPRWDFAFPFDGGFAIVCEGCRKHPVGEHIEVRDGKWGYIDRDGVEVVPLEHEREALPPPPSPPR